MRSGFMTSVLLSKYLNRRPPNSQIQEMRSTTGNVCQNGPLQERDPPCQDHPPAGACKGNTCVYIGSKATLPLCLEALQGWPGVAITAARPCPTRRIHIWGWRRGRATEPGCTRRRHGLNGRFQYPRPPSPGAGHPGPRLSDCVPSWVSVMFPRVRHIGAPLKRVVRSPWPPDVTNL